MRLLQVLGWVILTMSALALVLVIVIYFVVAAS
jgi:hypothetical protein